MLTFDYSMELNFAGGEAREHSFTLRCIPQEEPTQHVESMQITVSPCVPLSRGTDAFGNRYCFGIIHQGHSSFRVNVSGRARRMHGAAPASLQSQMIYRQQTAITEPGSAIRQMYSSLGPPLHDSYLQAVKIRETVHSYMEYTPGATCSATTAEESALLRQGVCQDYSHIMLSLCRMYGIPCRYTAGLLTGEGESHAWVEVCSESGQWRALDPTNPDSGIGDRLTFSHGRDATDCEINRGVYMGSGTQVQRVSALMFRSEQHSQN